MPDYEPHDLDYLKAFFVLSESRGFDNGYPANIPFTEMAEYLKWHSATFADPEWFFDFMRKLDTIWLEKARNKINQVRKAQENKAKAKRNR